MLPSNKNRYPPLNQNAKNNFLRSETPTRILWRSPGTDYEYFVDLIFSLDRLYSFIKTMCPSLLVYSSFHSHHFFIRQCTVTAMRTE